MNAIEEGKRMKKEECPGVSIEDVLWSEFQEINLSRQKRLTPDEILTIQKYRAEAGEKAKVECSDSPPVPDAIYRQAHKQNLIGLALSGGGIRSATFNLGVLQGLAEVGLLRFIDYLSTVSGGGYIGSWLASWISRSGSVKDVEKKLCPEPQATCTFKEHVEVGFLRKFSNYLTPKMGFFGADTWAVISTYLRNLSLNLGVLVPLFIAILLWPAMVVWVFHLISVAYKDYPLVVLAISVISFVIFLGIGIFFIRLNLSYQPDSGPKDSKAPWYTGQGNILLVIVLPIMISALLGIFSIWLSLEKEDPTALWYILGFGMPLFVIVYMAIITLQIGFAGRNFPDGRREWWSRLGGWLFIFVLLWAGLFSVAIFGPAFIIWVSAYGSLSLGTGWLIASISGILAGKSPATGKRDSNPWMELLAKSAPYIFTAGLLLLFYFTAFVICIYVSGQWDGFWEELWTPQKSFSGFVSSNLYFASFILDIRLLYIFLASLLTAILFSLRIDINQFAIHLLYRNRLIRCYLGATNPHRHPQPFTGFEVRDDLPLCGLVEAGEYYGPYPIINTALNLVSNRNLAWQQRKATSFILSPKFSGYDLSVEENGNASGGAYRPTSEYDNRKGLTLGEAMAISGAAASPNMGYHSSPPLAFLMTFFNLRLGWWSGNTRYEEPWKKASPNWGLRYLISELFGLTDDRSKYVYLSDGGHFENLGIYELVRRRCRLIIASDASCDPEMKFDDLGNAIRKVRVDLGVPIDIDLTLMKEKKAHCAEGTIRYTSVDKGDGVQDGILIYIKPIICGKESADVSSFASSHKKFPHESTADQWFDESQFESYRMLGLHSMSEICGAWKGTTPFDLSANDETYFQKAREGSDGKKEGA